VPTPDSTLRGRLKALSIADVLVFLRGLGRSGRLQIENDGEEVLVDLRGPYVVRALSSRRETSLDEFLLASGRITRAQHEAARTHAAAREDGGLVRALIATGSLTPRDLQAARREQARGIVLALFDWSAGTWQFDDGRSVSGWSAPVDLDILDLVAGGIRAVGRLDRFAERLPSAAWSFEALPSDAPPVTLETHERHLLELFGAPRTLEEAARLADLPLDEARRALFLLLTTGAVRPRTAAVAADAVEPPRALLSRFNGLYGRVYQYLMLELGPISDSLLRASLADLDGAHGGLFERARFEGDGTLDADLVEANLGRVTGRERRQALVDGLSELLYRELLVLRQALGPEHERRLLTSLRREGLLSAAAAGS
jgi:hypothetical protein